VKYALLLSAAFGLAALPLTLACSFGPDTYQGPWPPDMPLPEGGDDGGGDDVADGDSSAADATVRDGAGRDAGSDVNHATDGNDAAGGDGGGRSDAADAGADGTYDASDEGDTGPAPDTSAG